MSFIKVTKLHENEDGSADVELKMDNNTKALLIQEGFIVMLLKGIEADKPKKESLYEQLKRWIWKRICATPDLRQGSLREQLERNIQGEEGSPATPGEIVKPPSKSRAIRGEANGGSSEKRAARKGQRIPTQGVRKPRKALQKSDR